jgi:hypothetical protein
MILQIHRDRLKPGAEATFDAIERDAASACRTLNGPHPHVAIEILVAPQIGGPHAPALKEVWWVNAFDSEEEKQRVYDAYAANGPLMAALSDVGRRRPEVIASEVDVFATHRADLSRGASLRVTGARFFVVVVTDEDSTMDGAVFETAEGTRYIFKATRSGDEAEALATRAGQHAAIFAVRPEWGKPSQEWIDADRVFWKS